MEWNSVQMGIQLWLVIKCGARAKVTWWYFVLKTLMLRSRPWKVDCHFVLSNRLTPTVSARDRSSPMWTSFEHGLHMSCRRGCGREVGQPLNLAVSGRLANAAIRTSSDCLNAVGKPLPGQSFLGSHWRTNPVIQSLGEFNSVSRVSPAHKLWLFDSGIGTK